MQHERKDNVGGGDDYDNPLFLLEDTGVDALEKHNSQYDGKGGGNPDAKNVQDEGGMFNFIEED